jgi:plasmid stabilization system protein ParE
MGSYTLSGEADADVQSIAEESVKRWGLERADKYILALHETFERLAEFPNMGRDASHIRSGYMQIESAGGQQFQRSMGSDVGAWR